MNGEAKFGIRTWSDVGALGALLLLGVGVIAWGLKLEARIDENARRISALESQVGNGILPRAEERVDDHERRIERLEDRLQP